MRDIEIYKDTLKKYEEQINSEDNKQQKKCICYKGCSFCCHQLIIISDFEKNILENYISSLTFFEKLKLKNIVKKQCKILNNNNLTYKTITPYISEEKQKDIKNIFFSLNLNCPFLENNICKIHEIRPISCMTYRNYGNKEDCEKSVEVKGAKSFDNIEKELRTNIYIKTNKKIKGFNVLQFALLEILNKK